MRLASLVKTESILLKKGKKAYRNLPEKQMNLLKSLGAIPVQRNSGIDGFFSEYLEGKPISIKIQREEETLDEAVFKLKKASKTKQCSFMILIRTHADIMELCDLTSIPHNMKIIDCYEMQIDNALAELKKQTESSEKKAI